MFRRFDFWTFALALTDFIIIRRSMTSRLFSTITTIITVAVAVGLMLVLLSMRDAGRRAFERGSGNMHLLVSADSNALTAVLNGIFYAEPPQRPITWSKYQQIAGMFPFEYAVPTQLGDSYKGLPVMGTTGAFFSSFKPDPEEPWRLAKGRFFEEAQPFEVVVGAIAARERGMNVGDELFLTHGIQSRSTGEQAMEPHEHRDYEYTVVGILEPTGTPHDRALFTSLESSWIIHAHDRRKAADASATLTTAADLADADRLITGIYLRLATRPGSNASAMLAQAFDTLRRDTAITVAQPAQQINTLFKIISNIDRIFLGMAAVVMVSSGIAVMLALYNSMAQRRRQIAVLRVLGSSRGRIFGLVITESAIIGMLGAAAGLALCLIGGQIVAAIMKDRLGLVIEPVIDPAWTLGVIVASIALAALAGLVPAAMAYRTPVAANLKPMG